MATQKKILIIGNGFDLYHELPTRYVQFIQVLRNIEKFKLDNSNDVFFEEIFQNVDRKNQIAEKYDVKNILFEKDSIEIIQNIIHKNKWYKLFKDKLDFENWIDFENEIKEVLVILNKIILKINSLITEKISLENINISHIKYGGIDLQFNKKEIDYLLKFELINSSNQNDFYELKNEHFEKSGKYLIKFKSDSFFDKIFEDLTSFINVFNDYLFKIVGVFYGNAINENSQNSIKPKWEIDEYYNFNYTPTLENFYKVGKKVNYIHGKIEIINHNIVMGIDDIEIDLKNDKIFMFSKYYQKLFNNTDYGFLNHCKVDDTINFNILVFGHSLSENDRNYVEEIFSKSNNKKSKIYVFYINNSDKSQKLKNLLNIIGKEKIEFYMKNNKLEFIDINDSSIKDVLDLVPKSTSNYSVQ